VTITPTVEQQRIIDQPLAPLRVAAGAGTGKTTTIALRLASLVLRDRIEPETALGITFTNKAAEELSDRLRVQLPELAHEGREVEVTTYHGFAHKILAEFGPMVGMRRDVSVIGPGYQRQLLRDALAATPTVTLDLTSPARRVDELATLSSRLGDHLRSPADLSSFPATGDVADTRREMARVLDHYAELKQRLGVVDYSDLIRVAHEIVSGRSIAQRIRDRYRLVLLDEYQDTNPAQRELLLRLFGDGFPVTAVGDPDQTIYEWRGASLENFSQFPSHFSIGGKPAPTLTLGLNRRSDRRIVKAANLVKEQIGAPGSVVRLEAGSDAGPGSVELEWFHSATDEADWIASEVRRLHDDVGYQWRDIALLFRKNRSIPLVRQALEAVDVPVEVAALGGLLQVPEVSDIHAWMRMIARPDDTAALARILMGSSYRLGLGDLALLTTHSDRLPLEAIDEGLPHLPADLRERLSAFRDRFRHLLSVAQGVTLVELVRRILEVTGAWAEVETMEVSRRLSTRLNLYRFLDLAEEWSPLEGQPSLEAFLDYLELLEEDGASEELDTATLSGEDAVSLLTVHRAKGLEWSVVFVPAVCRGTFPSHPYGGLDDPDKYSKSIPVELRLDGEPGDLRARHEGQEWRTAYVALTRARHRLILTGAYWYTIGRPKTPSPLFELIATLDGAHVHLHAEDAGDPPDVLRSTLHAATPDPLFGTWEAAFARASEDPAWLREISGDPDVFEAQRRQMRLVLDGLPTEPEPAESEDGVRVSVSNLVTYATCPKRYFWTVVDPLPRRASPSARRGINVHHRIERHNLGMIPLTEDYDVLADSEAAGGRDPFDVYLTSRFAKERPLHVETPFDLMLSSTAMVRGRIDAIYEPSPGRWEIVDFKSGRRSDNPAVKVQLEAYALAAKEVNPHIGLSVSFAYLGGGLDVRTEAVDEQWLEAARSHLIALIDAIGDDRFSPSPSESCRWCDFLPFCEQGRAFLDGR
jgi:DNA helicase II / ATP-dependent DNA helicase PcrA